MIGRETEIDEMSVDACVTERGGEHPGSCVSPRPEWLPLEFSQEQVSLCLSQSGHISDSLVLLIN